MDRRLFLKQVAAGTLATTVLGVTKAQAMTSMTGDKAAEVEPSFRNFKFNNKGKFKLLQLTDTHYIAGDKRAVRALQNVREMLDTEKPDLVIHTGDIIYGKPTEQSLREILAPLSERKIPFAVTLGNHDGEFELSRKEVFDVVRTLPYNINTPGKGITGDTNDAIMLSSKDGKVQRVFYLLDSGNKVKKGMPGHYDYVHFDQVAWYRGISERFTEQNGGTPIPALVFMHIPVIEYEHAFADLKHIVCRGNIGEPPGCSALNAGLFTSMLEMGDVQGIVCGHEHDNDYATRWRGMFLMYGRYSGCDTVYNTLKPNGARVFEFTEGKAGFRSWVRLNGGQMTQDLNYPEDFNHV